MISRVLGEKVYAFRCSVSQRILKILAGIARFEPYAPSVIELDEAYQVLHLPPSVNYTPSH